MKYICIDMRACLLCIIKGSNCVLINCLSSKNDYGFLLSGSVNQMIGCQFFSNTTNQINGGNMWMWGCDVNQQGNSGIEIGVGVTGTYSGINIHGRFEGNNQNAGTTTGDGAGTYHIDASGASTTAGTSGSLLGTHAGGVNILPGTKFTHNAFGSWEVTYDIWTGGSPGLVNDWSTSDGNYATAHID
jgi:hypothetical protein